LALPTHDARAWGPQLRFSAPPRVIEKFYREIQSSLAPFLLFGSGDFHHLSALWIRRLAKPAILVSFDNHPDWAITPPRWACGGWINRALENPNVQRVSIWGCGNFECWWPHNILGNHRAQREGRLEVHPWADDRPLKDRQQRGAILRENWREKFLAFAKQLRGADVYITIDLDCLRNEQAITNWENGRFEVLDLQWALTQLRENAQIVAGDICGAYSPPKYARWKQKFAGNWDHPKIKVPDLKQIRATNFATLEKLWPFLAQ
jgi:arginase family enzyme